MSRKLVVALVACCSTLLHCGPSFGEQFNLSIVVPMTGVYALDGDTQRYGALLAVRQAPKGVTISSGEYDTGVQPDVAMQALERALSKDKPTAIVASMIGTQLLAMLPAGADAQTPMVTTSGTAAITEQKNPWIFRFYPGDPVAKEAHVRYVVEELKKKRIAVIYETTAYGQSGRTEIVEKLKRFELEPVLQEGVALTTRDMAPTIAKITSTKPDVIMLHLHAQPTAVFIRAAAQAALNLPIVSAVAIIQPTTAALLEPEELANVCGETNASPLSDDNPPEMKEFRKLYRESFNAEPDSFAVGQYDSVMMMFDAVAKGAKTRADIQKALATTTYKGLAMSYHSDGKGNMAHSALVACYDGKTRIPQIVKRYADVDAR